MSRKTILYVLSFLFVAGVVIVFYAYHEFFRKHEDVSDLESVYRRNAIGIIQEFKTNEQASNELYLGKVLTIVGTVKKIENTDQLYTVSLGDTTDLSSVRCTLDSAHSLEASALRIGSPIAIKGYCSGFNADELLGSDVILSRCALEIVNKQN
jgi:hypothetical protein